MMKGLSPFYTKWLGQELRRDLFKEPTIDCSRCRMTPECRGSRAQITYEPNLKCCTFEPFIPNFHVGALLESPEYAPVIFKQLEQKGEGKPLVIPLGLAPNLDYQRWFQARKNTDFGNREDLLCRHYDREKNQCSIWQYRGAVCTAFYCTSQYGKTGESYWKMFGDYLFLMDTFIAEEILADMGFEPRRVSDQLQWLQAEGKKRGALTESARKKLWPPEFKDVVSFYKACYKRAQAYSPEQVRESLGERGAALEQKLRHKRESIRKHYD